MTVSRLTYILGFSVKFFFQPIYTDYTNWTYFDKRSHWTIPDRFSLIWFSGCREKDFNVIFHQNMPNLYDRYESAERKISEKSPEYIYVKLLIAM
jgi:hypothetical protein